MRRFSTLLFLLAVPGLAADASLSAARIRADVKYPSSDQMEGRGLGQKGGDLATQYIADQFAKAGLKPAGDNGSWFQKVPLVGIAPQAATQMSIRSKGKTLDLKWGDDVVGVDLSQRPEQSFDGQLVFVGHGIAAPEFHWDDYKGVNVAGKVVVLFTNEPPSNDPKFFDGRALTYYGRWTYKYEEALRHGAKAALIIHTTPAASYGWDVVRNSWGRETPFVKLAPNEKALSLQGWISKEAGDKLL